MNVILILLSSFFINGFLLGKEKYIPKEDLFVLDSQVLIENKKKISLGSIELRNAKKELIDEANQIIDKGKVYSIVHKNTSVPGGSKNDYLSLAPYWWPDKKKDNGLPYIRKDGQVNPESKEIKDSQMVNQVCSDIYKLGLAYYFSGNEEYVNWINTLIDVFFINNSTRMNPNLNYSQIVRGRNIRGSITISGVSFIKLIEGVQLVQDSYHFNKRNYKMLKEWFSDFSFWLENEKLAINEAKANNNIRVYYIAQIVVYNLFTGNEEKAKDILEKNGKEIVDQQISPQGFLKAELKRAAPWNYIRYALGAFDYLVQLSKKLNVNLYYYQNDSGGSIDKLYKWLIPYAKEEKKWEYSKENPSSTQVQKVLLRSNILNYKEQVKLKDVGLDYINILTNSIY